MDDIIWIVTCFSNDTDREIVVSYHRTEAGANKKWQHCQANRYKGDYYTVDARTLSE